MFNTKKWQKLHFVSLENFQYIEDEKKKWSKTVFWAILTLELESLNLKKHLLEVFYYLYILFNKKLIFVFKMAYMKALKVKLIT